MSIIIDIGQRNSTDSLWFKFREECIYDGDGEKVFTDELYIVKRDEELGKIGAKWIDVVEKDDTITMFKVEFENDADATAFLLRWS